MDLSPQGNYIVGPNNVGKSNIVRALQLALRPEGQRAYNPETDIPKQKHWAYPTITLDFEMQRRRSPYKTLLRYVDEYERSVADSNATTFADQELVRYHVQYSTEKDSRQELFLANGAGSRRGDEELLSKALNQFHDVVRLVDIQSGEDLESLLQRGFNELFTQVLSERFKNDIDEARGKRRTFEKYLEEELLGRVGDYIASELPDHVPEVEDVSLSPSLDSIEGALGDVEIQMGDTVTTNLDAKGTGVRSAVIQMFMSFIADSSRRAIVFAIEEPEAFLHPQRHSSLGSELESFTSQSDISVLMTTHSPFILTQDSNAGVFTVSKNAKGRTIIESDSSRQNTIRRANKLLTGTEAVPTALDIIDSIPPETEAIIIVEGLTDKTFLQKAAERYSESDLVGSLHIVPSEGATSAAKNAVVLNEIFEGEKEVHVLLDDDDLGNVGYKLLTDRLNFQGKNDVSKYSRWRPKKGRDVEAEDLFPDQLIEKFIDEKGEDVIEGYGERHDGTKHYEICSSAKGTFAQWIEENAKKPDCELWIQVLKDIRDECNI